MREDSFVSLSQSDICPQNFVGHKLSHRERTSETIKIESLKVLNKETLGKLLNGQDMFLFSQQRRENLNLLVPEPQVTMSITSQPCQVDKLKTKH